MIVPELPERMQAMVLTGHGDLDRLELHDDWPVPRAGAAEVVIAVGACSVNATDVNTRRGWYAQGTAAGRGGWSASALAFPRIQGADVCGRVVALGSGAPASLLGRRVLVDPWLRADATADAATEPPPYLGSERDGGFAQYVAVPAASAHPIDSDLSDAELATFPCAYVAAEHMLARARVGAGETVVVTGASGGAGSALVQLARCRGARVVAVTSRGRADAVAALGAAAVVEREREDLGAALARAAGTSGVDVVADVVGGELFAPLVASLRRRGRYVVAGAIGGPTVELDLRTVYLRDLELLGATVAGPEVFRAVLAHLEQGRLRPLLGRTYPLAQLREAQQDLVDRRHVGNLVIVPPPGADARH